MESFLEDYKRFEVLIEEQGLDFMKFNPYTIVYHSNAIEGSTLTEDETYILLNNHLTPASKPLQDTYMALDHYEALQWIIQKAEEKSVLTSEDIRKIASLVMKNTGSPIHTALGTTNSSKGEYRKFTVCAGNRTFMDAKKVPNRVEELMAYIQKNINSRNNSIIDIYELAFEAHYQLVNIHPFADGNGRTSRLLMNYIQQYHNFPMTLVFTEDKSTYYKALEQTRNEENTDIFKEFMFAQSQKYFQREIEIIQNKLKPKSNSKGISFLF